MSESVSPVLDDVAVIDVHGALDSRHAGDLHDRARAAMSSSTALIIDLSDVSSIDAAGTAAIVHASVRAQQRGAKVAIVAGTTGIFSVLQPLGLEDRIPVVDDLDQARAELNLPEPAPDMLPTVFEDLPEQVCLRLLHDHHFGRLAVVVDGAPSIFPVNYNSDGPQVVIRTAPGTKLAGAQLHRVAFEIDGTDESSRTGWSVVVHGVGADISDVVDHDSVRLREMGADTWVPGPKPSWLRIIPTDISGRRLRSRLP
jgi:anti-anti-sigma factor